MVKFLRNIFAKPSNLESLSSLIMEAEIGHTGEIAVYLRDRARLFSKNSVRADAVEQFSSRRIWDTEDNIGVLVFVCLSKKAIEIVADRGASNKIQSSTWEQICLEAAEIFRNEKDSQIGLEHAIKRVGEELRRAIPGERKQNQISDQAVFI